MEKQDQLKKLNILMCGTGEYTTGYIGGAQNQSDKGSGVVALVLFDLRSKGMVDKLGMVGRDGTKFPEIRKHMQNKLGIYKGLDLTFKSYPDDKKIDSKATELAVKDFKACDAAIVFTPDDTHFDIAMQCLDQGMHVLLTKPPVKTLKHHQILKQRAKQLNKIVTIEVHKRWDQMYADARDRIIQYDQMGDFSYFYSYMSQPKYQLDTFKNWAGKSSDISYYLNSHHIDFHVWCMRYTKKRGRPIQVTASGSYGFAQSKNLNTEDHISLLVQWENVDPQGKEPTTYGTAVYSTAWTGPNTDVHTQQGFHYVGTKGEIHIDQAHRGYQFASDDTNGQKSMNPLYMKYTPSKDGKFDGQRGYGYRSIEDFVNACRQVNAGIKKAEDYDDGSLATISTTTQLTAILEAGRMSLDKKGQPVKIIYDDNDKFEPIELQYIKY